MRHNIALCMQTSTLCMVLTAHMHLDWQRTWIGSDQVMEQGTLLHSLYWCTYHDALALQVQDNQKPQCVVVEQAHTNRHTDGWNDAHERHLVWVGKDDLPNLQTS